MQAVLCQQYKLIVDPDVRMLCLRCYNEGR